MYYLSWIYQLGHTNSGRSKRVVWHKHAYFTRLAWTDLEGDRGSLPPPPEHLKLNVFLYKKAFAPPPSKNGTPSESFEKHIDKLRTQKTQSRLFSSRRNWIQRGSNFTGGGGGGGPNAYFYRNTYNLRFSGPIAPLTKIPGSARD